MLALNEVSFDTVLRGWSSGRRRPFVHLRFCAKPGHVSGCGIDFLCQKEFGLLCLVKREGSGACPTHCPPHPSRVVKMTWAQPFWVPNSKQVSNYSKTEVEGIGSVCWYVVILCWTLSSHNWILHVRSWLCRVFLLGNQCWYLETFTWQSTCFLCLWFPLKRNWDPSFPSYA